MYNGCVYPYQCEEPLLSSGNKGNLPGLGGDTFGVLGTSPSHSRRPLALNSLMQQPSPMTLPLDTHSLDNKSLTLRNDHSTIE